MSVFSLLAPPPPNLHYSHYFHYLNCMPLKARETWWCANQWSQWSQSSSSSLELQSRSFRGFVYWQQHLLFFFPKPIKEYIIYPIQKTSMCKLRDQCNAIILTSESSLTFVVNSIFRPLNFLSCFIFLLEFQLECGGVLLPVVHLWTCLSLTHSGRPSFSSLCCHNSTSIFWKKMKL